MGFPDSVALARFDHQKGICANPSCSKQLVRENRDKGSKGAWHAHHINRYPDDDSISNCAVVCINEPENCHLKFAHGGATASGYRAPKSTFKLDRRAH